MKHIENQAVKNQSRILLFAVLSGSCGLAYEVLFVRLFSNYFGDSFVVSGVTLCAVFLGISFGAWQSVRFVRWLSWIEITIGLYAVVAATVFSNWGFEIVHAFGGTWLNGIMLALLLGFPAFLIGTCVPLFAVYARTHGEDSGDVFTRIYGLYNLGAFLSILAIEFLLFRHFGLQVTIYLIGCLNLLIGFLLLAFHYKPIDDLRSSVNSSLNPRIAIALFLASIASGVFQLFVLRLSFSIFGPLHENFAIILASAILGVAIGSWAAFKKLLQFRDVPFWLSLFMLAFLVFVPALVQNWSMFAGMELSDRGELFAKIALLGGYPLPLFVLLGTLVPLAVAAHDGEQIAVSGKLFALSSLGNGLGALVMFLVLYRYLSLPQIGILIAGILCVADIVVLLIRRNIAWVLGGGVVAASLIFAGFQTWPYVELLLGYRILAQEDHLQDRLHAFQGETTYKAYDQSASLISFRDTSRSLVFNGYHSLSFGPGGKSDLHETIVGAAPALFVENAENALVLGLGTGITAGATARIFGFTRVVEINPAILNIPRHFESENHNVMSRLHTEIILQDGVSVLLEDDQQFDAIINTVTSPKYYAASKLYTTDFLQLAKSRLATGGVYSTWFDLNIDREGIAIMLNTLEVSFRHCRYFVLTGSYFNAVCADHPLIYKSNTIANTRLVDKGFDRLFKRFGFPGGFVKSMSALEISFEEKFFKRSSTNFNTLDRPAIEFVVARNSDKEATTNKLSETILANLEFQRKFSFGSQDWKINCRSIARMSYLEFSGCETKP